ncbi:major facilitator superfamily domain-containing protein [Cyathus striatus]|nr:major facilitator superfamily domain-containing protein [Cyathus striatus]
MTGFAPVPLAREQGDEYEQKFKGVSKIIGPKWAHLPTLTVGLLGVQIFWSVEMSYASPYLLSLGLSKSNMAVVFIAGPLSGLLMQPLIGVLADNSTSRFGRRRPYMIMGTIVCMLAMLLLGFTRPVASIFTGWDNSANNILTIWLAVLSIYLIDFSINAVQAVDRALLVDTIPSSQQPQGNAWAARMLGVGSVIGFFVGNINLPAYFPFLGKSQLQVLSVVVSVLLLAGHLVMAFLVKEKVLLKQTTDTGKSRGKSFVQEIKAIWTNMLTLPRVIRQICMIQFFAWLAWFPILFYTTIYVGDLHKRASPMPQTDEEQAALDTEATRLGSRALFCSSVLSLLMNVILPAFVAEAAETPRSADGRGWADRSGKKWWEKLLVVPRRLQVHLASLWAVSHGIFAACMLATFFTESVFGATILITVTGFSWAITQWAPFSLLAEAILTEPASLSYDEPAVIRLADARTPQRRSGEGEREVFLSHGDDASDDEGDDEDEELKTERSRSLLGNSGAQLSRIDVSASGRIINGVPEDDDYVDLGRRGGEREEGGNGGGLSAKAGIILGIHNVFIVIPQFLITGLSAVVFAIFDPEKSVLPEHHGSAAAPGTVANGTVLSLEKNNLTAPVAALVREFSAMMIRDAVEEEEREGQSNSVVYVFRFGGLAATIACILGWRLARELRHR